MENSLIVFRGRGATECRFKEGINLFKDFILREVPVLNFKRTIFFEFLIATVCRFIKREGLYDQRNREIIVCNDTLQHITLKKAFHFSELQDIIKLFVKDVKYKRGDLFPLAIRAPWGYHGSRIDQLMRRGRTPSRISNNLCFVSPQMHEIMKDVQTSDGDITKKYPPDIVINSLEMYIDSLPSYRFPDPRDLAIIKTEGTLLEPMVGITLFSVRQIKPLAIANCSDTIVKYCEPCRMNHSAFLLNYSE